jgi:class 3 adenylate cyclase
MIGMLYESDVRDVLPTIRVPTLVISRAKGPRVTPEHGRYIADRIPGARFIEVAGSENVIWAGDTPSLVEEIQEFLTGVRHAPEPDRVLSTVLFTDIVDSTRRAVELGDRRWREVLSKHDAIVRAALGEFRGREVKTTGDGFLATFDGPARSVRCAQTLRQAVRELEIEIRAGLHTGEIELIGNDVGGIAVHIAARILALAGPNEILASSTVKDLVAGSGIAFEDRGVQALRGVPDEWRIVAVAG